ncbi:Ubiquitin-conjugating enzyme E2 G2 [Chionoecetes opilio]|uniref:Ubiquitin-conjugating enzyme E2 G2 n=1 Tax=Chionoecetes opilio TaxID=41210 RepID=A0A8J4XYJ1_CHIOP|nr:Ubiquitin-conjugating enzyme E2 G2 [Chionoecetes opilio]
MHYLAELTLNPPEGIIAGPTNEENFFEWEALIVCWAWSENPTGQSRCLSERRLGSFDQSQGMNTSPLKQEFLCLPPSPAKARGPEGTCFECGVFPAKLIFPPDYPLSPPKMQFTCEMFHPNSEK